MNLLIVEDEPAAARRLQKMLRGIDDEIVIVATCESVSATVAWIQSNPTPDLIFMDIQLADGLSFEIFKHVKLDAPIVFATAYDAYAVQAFKVNSIDYLLKPIDESALRESLEKFKRLKSLYLQGVSGQGSAEKSVSGQAASNTNTNTLALDVELLLAALAKKQPAYRTRFLVEQKERFAPIAVADVAYFYSEYKLTYLVMRDGRKFLLPQTLEELESELNPTDFFRANRQFIVGAESVAAIHAHFGGKLLLDLKPLAPAETLVSREKASAFKAWLDR
jgi:two-component system, LytTR family, response regulator LytT